MNKSRNLRAGLGAAILVASWLITTAAQPAYAQDAAVKFDAASAAAIRMCSTEAAKYPDYVWGNTKMFVYRACVAARGQQE